MAVFDQFKWINECQGIEIHILPDGNYSCRYCTVSLEKDSLTIGKKEIEQGDRTVLFRKASEKVPLAITLTGKGILTRKIPRTEELNNDQLNQLFPNLKAEEFYIQNFISGPHSYLSLVRKDLVDGILQIAEKKDLKVLMVSAGPFVGSYILKQLNNYSEKQVFDGHIINSNKEQVWEDYQYRPEQKSEFPLKVDIDPIKEEFVLAYATAFQLALAQKLPLIKLPVQNLDKKFEHFSSKLLFKFRLSVMIVVFFILLLINFLVFSSYHSENEELLAKVSQTAASAESLNQLNQNIRIKEASLKELGWHKGKSYARICDQLGQGIPKGIILTTLSVNPLNSTESNRLRKEVYDEGKIKIKGEAKEAGPVNEWIYLLKGKNWIKDLNLDSFSPAQEGDTQTFEITISY